MSIRKLRQHISSTKIHVASRQSFHATLLITSILGSGFYGNFAYAQDIAQPTKNVEEQLEDEEIERNIITTTNNAEDENIDDDEIVAIGTRLRNNAFASDLPIQVIDAEVGELLGVGSTQELLRRSTLLTGSQQADGQQAVVFIGGRSTEGGNGINSLSLRGLGAQRTLVLLDGRRLGPSGSRGAVSTPNISIIPSSIVARAQILKDGASSIYGSDAIAGIVDTQIIGATDKDYLTGIVNLTEDGGAEFFQGAGRWSKTFDRGHFNIAAQVDKSNRLRLGDRDFTDCRDPLLTDPTTGQRVDIRDANGEVVCTSFGTNNRFFLFRGGTGAFLDPNSINARFSGLYIPDPDGTIIGPGQDELRPILPEFARVGIQNLGRVNGGPPFFGSAAGDFNLGAQSQALLPQTSDIVLNSNARNPENRYSIFANGAYELSSNVEAYGQVLFSRVETEVDSFRFLFDNLSPVHPSNTVGERIRIATNGALSGALGFNLHRPFTSDDESNYGNIVVGARGVFGDNIPLLTGWDWDVYAQHSRSDVDYTTNFTRQDRLNAVAGSFNLGCDTSFINPDLLASGETAQGLCDSIGGGIPFLSPRILRDGNFNAAELAFLEGTETGNTRYDQTVIEGFVSGEVQSPLPAGDVSVALGFHLQHDLIDDQPGPNSLAGNNHNFSNAQPTNGHSALREVFGEIGIPLVEGKPFFDRLHVNASGRFTDNTRIDDGGAFTYKVGAAWNPVKEVKLRANYGTSYRSPALFELFQGGTASFGAGDPCANLQNSNRPADEIANLTQNCGLFGLGLDFMPTTNVRTLNQGNNTGTLEPETSTALNLGIVLQPDFNKYGRFSAAADYFEIRVKDQIGRIGAGAIITRCLVDQSFTTLDALNADPFCALLLPRDNEDNLTDVINGSINIAEQVSRGIDYTVQYSNDFGPYDFNFNGTVTHILEDFFDQDRDIVDPFNDDIDRTLQALRPTFTGDFNLSLRKGPLAVFWATRYIGSSNQLPFILLNPNTNFTEDGTTQFTGGPYRFLDRLAPDTKVESYLEHTVSFRYNLGDGLRFNAGVQNIFDKEPPQVGGNVQRVGTSASGPYDFRGRRFFLRATKVF